MGLLRLERTMSAVQGMVVGDELFGDVRLGSQRSDEFLPRKDAVRAVVVGRDENHIMFTLSDLLIRVDGRGCRISPPSPVAFRKESLSQRAIVARSRDPGLHHHIKDTVFCSGLGRRVAAFCDVERGIFERGRCGGRWRES